MQANVRQEDGQKNNKLYTPNFWKIIKSGLEISQLGEMKRYSNCYHNSL